MYYGEKFNSITHLVGAVFALMGLGSLLTIGYQQHDAVTFISFMVFGVALVAMYTVSTLYHSFQSHKLKHIFRKLDHATIYFLIAGTYTPYMMVALESARSRWMLAGVWLLACIGLTLDLSLRKRIEALQVSIYLLMGWCCLLVFPEMMALIPEHGLWLLVAGGVAYTLGITFYVLDLYHKLRHAHGIWHLFVLTGSLCHFSSIIGWVR